MPRTPFRPILILSFLLVLCFGLTGCGKRSVSRQLEEAEALITDRSDSTISILVNLDTVSMTEMERQRRDLLLNLLGPK